MRLGEIDRNLKVLNPNLFLCKPDKKTIGKLKEAYDINYSTKLGTVNEISFKIPTVVEKDRVPITNPNIEKIKHRYLFKLTLGNSTEYFVFNERNKNASDDEYVEYHAFSLGFQLADKNMRRHEWISKSLVEMLNDVLQPTNWKVGYVDSEFELTNNPLLRSHEVSSQTRLQVVYELATKFNAVIIWDTVNLEINLYKPENVGLNKGLRIKEGKYLEALNLSSNSEETITRLVLIGAEDLSIRRLSATGSNYIEDFSYYIYPFERDASRNVIKESDYLSNDLCHALLDYQEYLISIAGSFKTYTEQLTTIQKTLNEEEQILNTLEDELILILDELDVSNANFQMTADGNEIPILNTPAHQEIIARRIAKEAEIADKISHIATIVSQETAKQNQITDLVNNSKIEVHLGSLMLELNQFIIEKEYTNDIIVDDEDLLKEGIEAFNQFREPKVKLEVDIVNFLSIVECQNDWHKLVLGDEILVKHDRLGVHIKAKIVEINYDFESDDISLVIANEKEIKDDDSWIEDMLYNAGNTSTVVNMDKFKWDLAEENNGTINAIINSKWDALKNAVVAGFEQKVEINERGITVRSLADPNSWLVIQNGFLAITNDRGNSWKHAITKDGIVGERIYGKIIMGVNLAIEDESGILKFRGSRGQIFDRNGIEVMRLGLVSDDDSANECFGITSWNSVTKVALTDCEGVSIYRKKLPNDWEKIFWVRASDGTLFTRDMVAEQLKIVNNIGEEILNAETGFFDIGWFTKIVADGKLTTTEKYELWNKVNTIMSEYQLLLTHAESYKYSPKDNTYNYNAQNVPASITNSNNLIVDTTQLKLKYASLIAFVGNYISIPPIFDDVIMERTDEIDRETFAIRFKEYYDEAQKVREAIDDYMVYSGLQLGKFYNNLIMDSQAGFMAIRNDFMYRSRLSATEGLVLEKWENGMWTKKLFATNEGTLKAVDLIAQKLIVTGAAGEVFIDANIGLIDFSAFKMIVGQLQAENISANIITAQDGFINDLVVNRVKTMDSAFASSGGDYIHMQDNYIKFIEATSTGSSGQAYDFNGNPMYWTDGSQTQRTLKNTGYPVMVSNFSEIEKMKLHFTTKDGEKVPVIEMSVGGTGTNNMGYIYKTTKDMVFEYFNATSKQRRIRLRDEGIIMDTQDGVVVVNGGNFYVSATSKESGWTKDTFKSDGGFFIPANANGVYNQFESAARWKLDDDNYIFQDKTTLNFYFNKEIKASVRDGINGGYGLLVNGTVKASHLELTAGSGSGGTAVIKPNAGGKLRLEADASNYIEISSAGIIQKGTVIKLN